MRPGHARRPVVGQFYSCADWPLNDTSASASRHSYSRPPRTIDETKKAARARRAWLNAMAVAPERHRRDDMASLTKQGAPLSGSSAPGSPRQRTGATRHQPKRRARGGGRAQGEHMEAGRHKAGGRSAHHFTAAATFQAHFRPPSVGLRASITPSGGNLIMDRTAGIERWVAASRWAKEAVITASPNCPL